TSNVALIRKDTGVCASKWVNSTGCSASCRTSGPTWATSHAAGTMNSINFRTNWNACTYVAARIPPSASVMLTASPERMTPTQYGVPLTTLSTSPAVRNCGTRYSTLITSTTTAARRRRVTEPRRASAKSGTVRAPDRSEEHTSELQSRENLVCRLLLEKKNKK